MALLHGLGHVTAEEVAAELPRQGVITGEIDGRLMATTEDVHARRDTSSPAAGQGRHAPRQPGRRARRGWSGACSTTSNGRR